MRFKQEHYELIVKILQNGAPALSQELIQALNTLLTDNKAMATELAKYRAKEQEEMCTKKETEA